ncbi:MAG: hypothetical protein ACP5VR_12925 [Acidimicrobiales bacterium]
MGELFHVPVGALDHLVVAVEGEDFGWWDRQVRGGEKKSSGSLPTGSRTATRRTVARGCPRP